MPYISELLPNPAGKDTEGEWIEICNSGEGAESLSGYSLQNAKGKTFHIPAKDIEPHACAAFDYAQTRITLTNNGGTLYLLDSQGQKIDTAVYEGAYADNISAMRMYEGGGFIKTSTPTKGYANRLTEPATKEKTTYAYTATIQEQPFPAKTELIEKGAAYGDVLVAGLITSAMLMGIFWYCFKNIHDDTNEENHA